MDAGIYRHYKGPLYLVLGLAHDANAEELHGSSPGGLLDGRPLGEREVVVYVPLQLDGAHLGARMAVRTRADFFAHVCVKQGCEHYGKQLISGTYRVCVNGGHGYPRFAYLGETLTAEMVG